LCSGGRKSAGRGTRRCAAFDTTSPYRDADTAAAFAALPHDQRVDETAFPAALIGKPVRLGVSRAT
jgi:hypothetical protein